MNSGDIQSLANLSGAVVVVVVFLKYMQVRDKSQEERDNKFAEALDKLTSATERSADATERSADEAAHRNGHLAELAVETQKIVSANHKVNIKAIKELKQQPVIKQDVYKQVINGAEVKS